ncbi:MAG: hypothetical protein KY475_13035 [Planctomycetes bacterium]|nr:hypothetical protein [Planctomycetota bacterium]
MAESIASFKRAVRFESAAAHGRLWDSRCGRFRVRESILLGAETPIYYAQQYVDGIWTVLKRHRKRDAAVRTLERAERGLPPDPKPRRAKREARQ